jgi:hypothetical protein
MKGAIIIMKTKLKTLVVDLCLLSIILSLTSCATNEPVLIPNNIDITSTEFNNKIPLRAGLYLSQQYRNAFYPIRQIQVFIGTALAGDALSYNSEKIMRNIFQEVIILDSMGNIPGLADRKYDVIVSPEIVTLRSDLGGSTRWTCWCLAQTSIKWNIVSPEGKEIYISTIKSDEIKIPKGYYVDCIQTSLKDLFQKSQEDIYKNNWWKKQWWKESNR